MRNSKQPAGQAPCLNRCPIELLSAQSGHRYSGSGALFPRFGNGLDSIAGIETDRFRPFHQFDDLDQLVPGFDVADVVLAAFEKLREINLAQASLLALLNQE